MAFVGYLSKVSVRKGLLVQLPDDLLPWFILNVRFNEMDIPLATLEFMPHQVLNRVLEL